MRNVVFAVMLGVVTATASWAQQPAAPAPPAAPPRAATPAPLAAPAPPAPPQRAQSAPSPRNIKFEIFITESGPAKPVTKNVSLTVNDSGGTGSVRNLVKAPGDRPVSLNVDVRNVQAFEDGAVRANVNIEYQPYNPDATASSSGIQASATSMFQDGRRMQILQTTDPLSDRRTTIEVLATVLK